MRRKALEQEAQETWKEDSLPIAITPIVTVNPDSIKAVIKEQVAIQKQRAPVIPTPKKTVEQKSKPKEMPPVKKAKAVMRRVN